MDTLRELCTILFLYWTFRRYMGGGRPRSD